MRKGEHRQGEKENKPTGQRADGRREGMVGQARASARENARMECLKLWTGARGTPTRDEHLSGLTRCMHGSKRVICTYFATCGRCRIWHSVCHRQLRHDLAYCSNLKIAELTLVRLRLASGLSAGVPIYFQIAAYN